MNDESLKWVAMTKDQLRQLAQKASVPFPIVEGERFCRFKCAEGEGLFDAQLDRCIWLDGMIFSKLFEEDCRSAQTLEELEAVIRKYYRL